MIGIATMDGLVTTHRDARTDQRHWTFLGGGLSLVVHLLLAALLLAGLPWKSTHQPLDETVVPVEFVEFAPAPTVERRKPETPPQAPPAPHPAAAAMPIAERSEAGAIPPPGARPQHAKRDRAAARPRLMATPRAKPKPPSRFDPARVAALIDRAKKAPPQAATAKPDSKMTEKAAKTPSSALADRIARASLQAALSARVHSCWIPPTGAKGIETMRVTLRIALSRDGRVVGMPRFIGAEAGRVRSDPFYRIFAESARRAVLSCAPYDDLPPALYRLWREIDFRFDGAQMYGGN